MTYEVTMIELYVKPYNVSVEGFYFKDISEYEAKYGELKDEFGSSIEDFRILFADGDEIDCLLFEALDVSQENIKEFLNKAICWDYDDKVTVIIAVSGVGYDFDLSVNNPTDFDVVIYELDSMEELAREFVDEGLFGEVSKYLEYYIDYEALVHDLSVDYHEAEIDGRKLIYRCD